MTSTGVPTKVFFFVMLEVSCPETPKSASFTSPVSVRSKLAAVISKIERYCTLDITMDLPLRVQIGQPKEHFT